MRNLHENSIDTFNSILAQLPDRRAVVFSVIAEHGPITCQDIAERIGKPINEVSGRVTELKKADLVRVCDTDRTVTNHPRALLRVRPMAPEQGRLAL